MRILQATYVRGVAGSEKFLLNAIPELKKRGHEVEMLVLYAALEETIAFQKLLEQEGIVFHLVNISGTNLLRSLGKTGRLMKQFDISNSHLLHADLTLSLAKRLYARKATLVSGKHGYEEWYNNAFGFDPVHKTKNKYWRVAKFAESKINRSFTISKGLLHLYTGLDICTKETTQLIYYGFEFNDEIPVEPQYRFGTPQLCMVGRLTGFKGHRFAIETIERLKPHYPEIRLIIVGWGELEAELNALVKAKGLEDNVIFTGFQPNPRSYMVASDVILIPSISEGFGIVIAEAMSVKRPIVAFNVPSPSELLVHRFSGLLAKPYDVEEYSSLVSELIRDPELQQTLSANAYQVLITDYNLNRMIDQLEDFYKG